MPLAARGPPPGATVLLVPLVLLAPPGREPAPCRKLLPVLFAEAFSEPFVFGLLPRCPATSGTSSSIGWPIIPTPLPPRTKLLSSSTSVGAASPGEAVQRRGCGSPGDGPAWQRTPSSRWAMDPNGWWQISSASRAW